MEKFARDRELAPDRAERTDTLVWGKNAVTELLKSGGAVDTVYLTDTMPQAVAGYYTALSKESGAVVKRVPANKLQKMCGTPIRVNIQPAAVAGPHAHHGKLLARRRHPAPVDIALVARHINAVLVYSHKKPPFAV